jgi:hypothetical protein
LIGTGEWCHFFSFVTIIFFSVIPTIVVAAAAAAGAGETNAVLVVS